MQGPLLNAHTHLCVIVLDGVCGPDGAAGVRFQSALGLGSEALAEAQQGIWTKLLRHVRICGFLEPHDAHQMLAWAHGGGFSLDASVQIPAHDREGLERLIRYCARPAFAHERLHQIGSACDPNDPPKPSPKGNVSLIVSPPELHSPAPAQMPVLSDTVNLARLAKPTLDARFHHPYPPMIRRYHQIVALDCLAFTAEKRREFVETRRAPLVSGKTPADIAPTVARSLAGPKARPEHVQQLVESISALHKESYLKSLEATVNQVTVGDIARITAPAHFIVGADDPLTPVALHHAMAAKMGGAPVSVIPDAGHLSNIEQAGAFNAVALDWLLAHR